MMVCHKYRSFACSDTSRQEENRVNITNKHCSTVDPIPVVFMIHIPGSSKLKESAHCNMSNGGNYAARLNYFASSNLLLPAIQMCFVPSSKG